jgi:hypothetical protein
MIHEKYIEYHIELSSLKDFVNKLIEDNILPIDTNYIFSVIKRAVISSEVAPFLRKPTTLEKDGYYEKYLRLEEENTSYHVIPDFFKHEDDFYDLDRNLNFSRTNINDEHFQELFALKLMELTYSKINLMQFLDFQLYDNYNGNKEAYAYLLYRLLNKDSFSYLLPSITTQIQQWIKENQVTAVIFNEEEQQIYNIDDATDTVNDHWEEKKNKKIEGKMSLEELKHYASFFYKEILERSSKYPFSPMLTKEEVDFMFANGLVIPAKPLETKYKITLPPRFPRKIVDFAIHKLYSINTITHTDKRDYLLFFANYIEDYANALNSKKGLESIAKNITGERSRKDKINWAEYIPKKFL